MKPNDGSMTTVARAAVDAHLDEEVTARDHGRAERYVATVRPAMAALRYVHAHEVYDGDNGQRDGAVSEDQTAENSEFQTKTVSLTDDSDGRRAEEGGVRRTEEGGRAAVELTVVDAAQNESKVHVKDTPELSAMELGLELTDDMIRNIGSVAKVRMAVRRTQREAKRRRAKRALERRAAAANDDDELTRSIAELDAEQRLRRQQQGDDARRALEVRQRRNGSDGTTEMGGANVNLLQKRGVESTAGSDDAGDMVRASDGLPTATVWVDGQRQSVKIDSGARYSVAGTDWILRGERLTQRAPVDHVEGIGGLVLDVLGVWSFEVVNVFGQKVSLTACILDGCTDEFLIGVDFLERHRATIDFEGSELRYSESRQEVVIPFRTDDGQNGSRVATVRLARAVNLHRCAVQPVEVSVTAPDGEEGIFLPSGGCGAVMLAAAVTKVRNGKAPVPVINTHGGRVKLPSRRELGEWFPLDADMNVLELNGELQRQRLKSWLSELGNDQDPLENEDDVNIGTGDAKAKELVIRLLRSYRNLMNTETACPPATTVNVEHHIDTGNTSPIMLKRRRHAQTEDATVDENVDEMLGAGVVEESDGAWGFPVVLVKKRDGSVRFCVDYRALNRVTKRDVYPLPRIDETLEALGGAKLFTTLDLRSGYWQIKVAQEDRDKTAFITKRGLYRFTRMPFGLTNAPATFQRLMNGVLRGLTWSTCLVYLDDIVVYTRGGIERHIVELAAVLERLSAAGLTLKLKKCVFAAGSMEYLGHALSSEGVQPVDRLVRAVVEFPRPSDAIEVKGFVHLAGYYRKFIEAFGSIAAPLTTLLKKDVPWMWTETQEFAFERIKSLLTTKPLLKYPDFGREFRLVTDASTVGLGACLTQDFGHGWQPIAFASKVNSHAESNYSITELECLAVVWAVKQFRPYLYGRAFEIITDHAALRWLMTRPNLAGRLQRWSLTLQEYDFVINYRPGATNVVADALSRAPAAVRAVVSSRPTRRRLVTTNMDSSTRTVDVYASDAVGTDDDLARTTTEADDIEPQLTKSGMATVELDATAREDASTGSVTAGLAAAQTQLTDDDAHMDVDLENGGPTAGTVNSGMGTNAADVTTGNTVSTANVNDSVTTTPQTTASDPQTTRTDNSTLRAKPTEMTTVRRSARIRAREQRQAPPVPEVQAVEASADMQTTGASDDTPALPEGTRGTTESGVAVSTGGLVPSEETTPPRMPREPRTTIVTRVPARESNDGSTGRRGVTVNSRIRKTDEVCTTKTSAKPATRTNERRMTGNADSRDGTDGDDEIVPMGDTLQLRDDEIMEAQKQSRFVKKLLELGVHQGMQIETRYGLVTVKTKSGWRVVLPPTLWSVVFKEMHGSVWSGHLKGPHTYGRVSQLYWWPNLQREVHRWVRGCQECGSRKSRPREVIPPLRSIRGGDVGDRWALDVAGPFPIADGGDRYVIAAVEYVTRYAVACCTAQHTAQHVAKFLMEEIVLKFGAFRELMTDGAPELAGEVLDELVMLLQARQVNPVPYRPQLIGLVERFHRSWKDCISTFMNEERQNDWNLFVKFAVYSYNSAQHSTVALSPNELMMGRRLRPPNELLRRTEVTEAGALQPYHERLLVAMTRSHACAENARVREQERQARYYNRRVRKRREFSAGDCVWVYNPPRGRTATKYVHQWMGPLRVVEPAGYDNFLLTREDKVGNAESVIAHSSFLVSYHYPVALLEKVASDLDDQLAYEDQSKQPNADATTTAAVRSTTASCGRRAPASGAKRRYATVGTTTNANDQRGRLVERRRRRRRNRAGQYTLEYELYPVGDVRHWTTSDRRLWTAEDGRALTRWVSVGEYEKLYRDERIVEDPQEEEVV